VPIRNTFGIEPIVSYNSQRNPSQMIRSLLLTLTFLFVYLLPLQAQQERKCAASSIRQADLDQNPMLYDKVEAIEKQTQDFIARSKHVKDPTKPVLIPVVVHILYNTGNENISNEQIASQIKVLNKDYKKLNKDINLVPGMFQSVVADCGLIFQLAVRDANGRTTDGIDRKKTSVSSFKNNDDMKFAALGGADIWDATKYLNIWVCNLQNGTFGYAQFPGGLPTTDGVVIDYRYFGTQGTVKAPYNRGRTATHEIGHWFNLHHIWGDNNCGDDKVGDTPQQTNSNTGAPAFPHYSNCGGKKSIDMTVNFMDYVNDESMHMFSEGQKNRIQATLSTGGVRASLKESDGCKVVESKICTETKNLAAFDIAASYATIIWDRVPATRAYRLEYKVATDINWTSITTTDTALQINYLKADSKYEFRVNTDCFVSTTEFFYTNEVSVGTGCSDKYESNETLESAKTIRSNTSIRALISSATDKDWFKIVTVKGQTNIKVILSNLHADCDLKLYNEAGGLIMTSDKKGFSNEIVTFNTESEGTYYIQVFGYNKDFNASECYSLTVNLSGHIYPFQLRTGVNGVSTVQEKGFSVYPNPIIEDATIELDAENPGKAVITMTNINGKVVFRTEKEVSKGNNTLLISPFDIPDGMYIISVVREGQIKSKRINFFKPN
jgi:hypothetical protein